MNAPVESVSEDEELGIVSYDDIMSQKTAENFINDIPRHVARGSSRLAETILGIPGDTVQLIRSIAQSLPGGIQPEEEQNFLQRGLRSVAESFPTSEEFRARTAENRPDLEPQSEGEEIADEVTQDFASMAIPTKSGIPFARALGLSVLGNSGKQLVKEFGVGEKGQNATKLGLMIFGGMFGRGRGVNSYINQQYDEAKKFIQPGTKTSYPMNKLDKFESMILQGHMNDAKSPAYDIFKSIKEKSTDGRMLINDATQFSRDINREIAKSGADSSKKGWLKQLLKVNEEVLDDYAKENPTWAQYRNTAKQAYKGIATSENIKEYIKSNANLNNLKNAAIILGLEQQFIPGYMVKQALGAGIGAAGLTVGQVVKRIATNPALRRYYNNVLVASLNENKAMLMRNLQGLERAAKKEFGDSLFDIVEFEEEED